MKPKLADVLKAVVIERRSKYVWAGDPNLCHEAYSRFGGTRNHPLDKIKSVIDAARRSSDFVQIGYIRACDASGRREVNHPVFALREKSFCTEMS